MFLYCGAHIKVKYKSIIVKYVFPQLFSICICNAACRYWSLHIFRQIFTIIAILISPFIFLVCVGQTVALRTLASVWVERWVLRLLALLNDLLQSVQEWGFSPVWVNMWSLRSPARPHDLLQLIHLCSFSPLWASMWFFRSLAQPNDFLLASVCFFRVPASLNYLLHLLHLCGFSPVWMSMCLLRFPAWLNDLLQMVHLCGFSSVCVIMCFLRTSARFMSTTMPSTLLTFMSTTMSAALSVYKVVLVKNSHFLCLSASYSRDHILNSEMTHSDQKILWFAFFDF